MQVAGFRLQVQLAQVVQVVQEYSVEEVEVEGRVERVGLRGLGAIVKAEGQERSPDANGQQWLEAEAGRGRQRQSLS